MTPRIPAPQVGDVKSHFINFLFDYLDWSKTNPTYVEGEVPNNGISVTEGLCNNFYRWLFHKGILFEHTEVWWVWCREIKPFLNGMWQADGLAADYPFGEEEYWDCEAEYTFHKDERRMAWVRDYIARQL